MVKARTVYDYHRPLRNYLRNFPLLESLYVVRAYEQHLQFDQPFPSDIKVAVEFREAKGRAEKNIFEWELDILTRELVLNASDFAYGTLKQWSAFSIAINLIKELGNAVAASYPEIYQPNILIELYRIAHNQFPWQRGITRDTVLRYFKIFGTDTFDLILKTRLGLGAAELYIIGLTLAGHFSESFVFNLPVKIDGLPITSEQFDRFVGIFSIDIDSLRCLTADSQSYDQDYAYVFNPLRKFPLIRISENGRSALVAPLPTFLIRRFTEGVYYELCDAPGFSDAFGPSFQGYVGAVLTAANPTVALTVFPEQPYHVGKDRKDSVDWIVSDRTADLFIECKTKRVRYGAKIGLASTDLLAGDLEKMAEFIFQTYKTLIDALDGKYTHWAKRDTPVYPLVVTLEEWFAFGDRLIAALDAAVLRKLEEEDIDPVILQIHPYTVCAVEDFEIAIQIMTTIGIEPFMRKKTAGECRLWSMHPFITRVFTTESRQVARELFPGDWQKIHPLLRN